MRQRRSEKAQGISFRQNLHESGNVFRRVVDVRGGAQGVFPQAHRDLRRTQLFVKRLSLLRIAGRNAYIGPAASAFRRRCERAIRARQSADDFGEKRVVMPLYGIHPDPQHKIEGSVKSGEIDSA